MKAAKVWLEEVASFQPAVRRVTFDDKLQAIYLPSYDRWAVINADREPLGFLPAGGRVGKVLGTGGLIIGIEVIALREADDDEHATVELRLELAEVGESPEYIAGLKQLLGDLP